ncbi:MAG: alpha/beta hydrolase-fold protein [Candidatus Thermoplasmatota archaeon]|nr:alpha/beta hydrolase-fold protein [Candidatus Thermoplasmatota archaeon]
MRSLGFAISILLLSCSFAGCASDGDRDVSEDPISEIDRGELGGETNEPSTISSEDCEERGGTWNEERGECYFESERPEDETERPEEETGPISVPPCNVTATEGLNSTANPSSWPEIQAGQWHAVDGLTDVSYASIELDSESEVVVDDRLDYECGYTYSVKVPGGYNASDEYPLFLYLHGQLLDSVFFNNMMTNNFYVPDDDKYIIVRPSKLELDWDAKKALDVLEDVKANLNVDDDRVYLTGLSMGGRGTFIVAAALPDYFAAIMPLTPHHEPYSYIPLAEDIAHLPVWMSHGTNDSTSSYDMAAQMAENLTNLGAEIEFQTVVGGEHGGWFAIYSDPEVMQWMLSHTRGQ